MSCDVHLPLYMTNTKGYFLTKMALQKEMIDPNSEKISSNRRDSVGDEFGIDLKDNIGHSHVLSPLEGF